MDQQYWLGHCEGFEVRAGERRLGLVECVEYGTRHDRPDRLWVRSGFAGTRELAVPVGDVETVDPGDETVWVSDALPLPDPLAKRIRDGVREAGARARRHLPRGTLRTG